MKEKRSHHKKPTERHDTDFNEWK